MSKGKIHIGTSGWHYKHWKGSFYPAETKDKDQFSEYLKHFSSVEINNSFYHLPSAETFTAWAKATPAGFIFSVKASRFITHMKKLKVDEASIETFLSRTRNLKNKLGPVLFQLPPNWKVNIQRLEEFLELLPTGHRYVFELRNDTWHTDEIFSMLKKYNCAFCIYELERKITPLQVTSDFVYVRLHGPGDKYQGSYPETTLEEWKKVCRGWQDTGKDVYVYFDNDQAGYAAFNAERLIQLVKDDVFIPQ